MFATKEQIKNAMETCRTLNSSAPIFRAKSEPKHDTKELLHNKRVPVIEDGPTVTHVGLPEGVGTSAATNAGASLLDPRKHAKGTIAEAFQKYKHIEPTLPALGYTEAHPKDLERSIQNAKCDAIVLGTAADLRRLIKFAKPVCRVRFEILDEEHPKFFAFVK